LDTLREALPGGLFTHAQAVANRGPRLPAGACLADEVIRHPVCLDRQLLTQRNGLVKAM
jgi:hypothetical protein